MSLADDVRSSVSGSIGEFGDRDRVETRGQQRPDGYRDEKATRGDHALGGGSRRAA